MRDDFRLRVVAGATSTKLILTALVGKRSNGTGRRISAYGYKPKIRATRFTPALRPAPDIRELNFRS